MSGLPEIIPPQQVHVGKADADGNVTISVNWYLFLYNLANQVLNQNNGSLAGNPADLFLIDSIGAAEIPSGQPSNVGIDAADISALGADIAKLRQPPQTVDSADVDSVIADLAQLRNMYQSLRLLIADATDPVDLPTALSVTITTAPLTTLGTTGSMTFKNGRLTAQTAAT